MFTTALKGVRTAAAGLMALPLALSAQETEECEFEASPAASTASELMQGLELATKEDSTTAYTAALLALQSEIDGDNMVVFLLGTQLHVSLENYEEGMDLLDRFDALATTEACAEHGRNQRHNAWVRLYNKGVAEYGAGETAAALEAFMLANRFQPDVRTYSVAGTLQEQTGDAEGAIATYREALAADISGAEPGELGDMVGRLGNLLLAAGQGEEAAETLDSYLASNPDNVVVRIQYAGLLAGMGRADEAQAIYTAVLELDDLAYQQWLQVGVGLFNSGSFDAAATAFGKSREGNPYNKEAMENFANATMQAGRPDEVTALADTLVTWYPYDALATQLLARALALAGDNDGAMEAFEQGEQRELVFAGVQMAADQNGQYIVRGSFTAASAEGDLAIPFEFLDIWGEVVLTETLMTTADAGNFVLTVQSDVPLAGFRYQKASGG